MPRFRSKIVLSTVVVMLTVISVYAFPPTTWLSPPDTASLGAAWNVLPPYSGTIDQNWPNIPLKDNAKILFIGNSITDAGGSENRTVDGLIRHFHPGKNVTVDSKGRGEAWLRDYINETELGILTAIRSGEYDFLICQPYQDSYWPKMPGGSLDQPEGLKVFVDACDFLYEECQKVGTQMVLWSVQGYQSDDRLWYLAYSAYNCQRAARRLNIPYAMTVETFDAIYRANEDPFLWRDIIHQSVEATAVFSTLIYSLIMGGETIGSWPANWCDISETNWSQNASAGALRFQDLLTSQTSAAISRQTQFNFGTTATVPSPNSAIRQSSQIKQQSAQKMVLVNGRTMPGKAKATKLPVSSSLLVKGSIR